jgi:hypothetical protein
VTWRRRLLPANSGPERLLETGFRETGCEIAVLEAAYADHARGWDIFVPNLGNYINRLVSTP